MKLSGGFVCCAIINLVLFIIWCFLLAGYINYLDYDQEQCYITDFNYYEGNEISCKTSSRTFETRKEKILEVEGYSSDTKKNNSILMKYDITDNKKGTIKSDFTLKFNTCGNSKKLEDLYEIINSIQESYNKNQTTTCWVNKNDNNNIAIYNSYSDILFFIVCGFFGIISIISMCLIYDNCKKNKETSTSN